MNDIGPKIISNCLIPIQKWYQSFNCIKSISVYIFFLFECFSYIGIYGLNNLWLQVGGFYSMKAELQNCKKCWCYDLSLLWLINLLYFLEVLNDKINVFFDDHLIFSNLDNVHNCCRWPADYWKGGLVSKCKI